MNAITLVTLRDYASHYRIHVTCPKCRHEALLNLMQWAQIVGWDCPLDTVKLRLRCGDCGNNVGIELRLR